MNTIKVQIGTFERTYTVLNTDSPIAYDGFGTLEIYSATIDGKPHRYVLVDVEHLEWQKGRYGSGLHSAEDIAEDLSEYVVDKLYKRLVKAD